MRYPRPLLLLLAASLASSRVALSQTTGGLCPVIKCPGTSTCSSYKGAPVCVCPAGQRLINNKCTSASLSHSVWLDWLNFARAAVGAGQLTWDEKLAAAALGVATSIGKTSGCALKHSIPKGQGQTLAGGPQNKPANTNESVAVLAWVEEGKLYSYHVFDAAKGGCSTGNWRDCGHYTQVIWNKTTNVGCGAARCVKTKAKNAWVWACNYSPPGNVKTQYPYVQDPCFVAKCPATASCDSSSGSAVCVCPKGQAVVNGVCMADPCASVTCPGDQVCDPSTGTPTCVCPSGKVAPSAGSTSCILTQCVGVQCPGTSTCALGNLKAPICICPSSSWLQGSACTSSPTTPLLTTSVAVYNSSGAVFVTRFSRLKQCVSLNGLKVSSYKLLWNAPASTGAAFPGSKQCSQVQFWNKGNCIGNSMGWRNGSDIGKSATGLFAAAKALKCV